MRARVYIGILVGLVLSSVTVLAPAAAQGAFGFKSLSVTATDREGNPEFQAGSHPYKYTVAFRMNQTGEKPDGLLRDLTVELPPGLVGNPRAVPVCPLTKFDGNTVSCPADTQIGTARVETYGGSFNFIFPLFNRAAPVGSAASLGFAVFGENSYQEASVRTGDDYGINITDFTIPTGLEPAGVKETIWGVPAESSHDSQRSENAITENEPTPSDAPPRPFLTLPSSCNGPLTTTVKIDSLEDPANVVSKSAQTPTSLDGCNKLEFTPTISAQATTNLSDSPTGLDFGIHQPQAAEGEPAPQGYEFCSPGNWSNEPSAYSYQWLRNGLLIPGATSPRYEVQAADAGTGLQCQVTAQNGDGVAVAISIRHVVPPEPSPKIPFPSQPRSSRESRVEGSETIFTCYDEGFYHHEEGFVEPSISYQWYSEGVPLAGETNQTLVVESSDVPPTVQCRVSAENAGGSTVTFGPHQYVFEQTPEPGAPEWESSPEIYEPLAELPLAPANLKDAKVTLPPGVTLNPAAGNGLAACNEQQIGYQPKEGRVRFSEVAQTCPNAAKLGTFEVSTPLLDHKLEGGVYLAKPFENPFGSQLALYLSIEDEQTGIYAKLGGKVEANPVTGQLTTTFTENPDLPLEDISLHLFNGRRAALTSPFACGTYSTTSTLTPWSSPEGIDAHPTDSFQTSVAASGSGTCPASEAAAPKTVAFSAGTLAPLAGAYSPFTLRIARPDGTQHITGIDITLPPGLVGKLAGIPYCPESGIARAISREKPEEGREEQSSPSCPSSSEVGTVNVTAGSGITPIPVSGHAYLAGPYKGAPLSLVVIVPAVAGPFDLGTVVDRVALNVDEYTARIHAVADPLPTIRDGIPLDVRSIELKLDRPSFTLNPTSCEAMAIEGQVSTQAGQVAPLKNSFQVGECKRLAFKPKLQISLKGPTKRTGHPALKAVVTYPKGGAYANIAAAQVSLPHSEFLDQGNIGKACTKVLLAAHSCPARSVYGTAKAWTPLLDKPLEGPVYLVGGYGYKLPALVAELDGQIRVLLVGKVDTDKAKGIRNTFEAVPDAPVERFVLQMKGGKKYGLLENSEDICRKAQKAGASFTAQSGKLLQTTVPIANSCGKGKKAGKGGKGKKGHKGGGKGHGSGGKKG